jgi:uncharacterized damage-inducible protein DinB
MNLKWVDDFWKSFEQTHVVTKKAIALFGDTEVDFRPRLDTRSVKEIVFHIYALERLLIRAIVRRTINATETQAATPEKAASKAELSRLTTNLDLMNFADSCHSKAREVIESLKEEDLTADVETPWGIIPAAKMFSFAFHEHWHHRGQLYVYLRLCGKKPPNLYEGW